MQSETNGAEAPFDEGANEDSYFAAKEHELIEGMKTEFHNRETAQRAAQMMRCPKCSGTFAKYKFIDFDLERCDSCEGLWLKKGELAAILRQQSRGPLGALFERCFAKVEGGRKS